MKILILANHYNTLRIFRRELIIALSKQNHEITIAIPQCDEENKSILESYGSRVIFVDVDRRGTNPLKDFTLLKAYKNLISEVKPDKVITYTIKCNIYGGMACKKYDIPHYANITGLGSTFQSKNILRKFISLLYKNALKRSRKIFFENVGNRDVLISDNIIKKEQAVVLPGAGVNLSEFPPTPYPDSDVNINFLFVGRIMREKGVDELFDVIKKIKSIHKNVEFSFIGWYEDNYKSIVEELESNGLLVFYGFQADVKPFIAKSHCVILPSWHEGMSNTLLESSSMCRPIITSNIHGCKEAVVDSESGYLCEVKNADSLCSAVEKFLSLSHEEKQQMGRLGRKHMEHHFDKNDVVNKTLNEIFN